MLTTTLHTSRLTLRRPVAADAEVIFERYASDPRVTRYMAWPTHQSVEDTRSFLEFCDAQWQGGPAGTYLIVRTEDGLVLGGTGLDFETATRAETGYVLAHDAWGCGYATEALGAMVDLARALGVEELTAGVHPDHRASIRVLEKGGFRLRETHTGGGNFPNHDSGVPKDRLVYVRVP